MVYGIIIFHLDTFFVYFNNFYFEEGNNINKNIRIQFIIRNIMNDYIFKKQTAKDINNLVKIEINSSIFDKIAINKIQNEFRENYNDAFKFCEGCLTVFEKDLFESKKILVWRQIKGYCISLILEESENIMLASNFLSLFLCKIENLSIIEQNLVLISEYLDEFLPNGELMFISVSYSDYLEKNLKKITNLQKKKN